MLLHTVLDNIKNSDKYDNPKAEALTKYMVQMMSAPSHFLVYPDKINDMKPEVYVEFCYVIFACVVQLLVLFEDKHLDEKDIERNAHYKKVVELFESIYNINDNTKNEAN